MKRGQLSLCRVVCFAVALLLSGSAVAEPRVIVVAAAEHGPTVTHFFEAVVQARLPQVGVSFVAEERWRQETASQATLVFHLDTRDQARWRLRLTYGGRAWRRRLEGGLVRDRAAIEAAALMAARTSVALLMGGDEAGPTDDLEAWAREPLDSKLEREASASEPSAAVPPRDDPVTEGAVPTLERGSLDQPWLAKLLGAYRGGTYAPGHAWGHGAKVGLQVRRAMAPQAALAYVFLAPTDAKSEFGSFTVARQQAELLVGWQFPVGPAGLNPQLGGLVEMTSRSEALANAGVGSSPAQRRLDWAIVSALELSWPMLDRLEVFASVGALYFTSNPEFLAEGVSEPLLAPHRVRLTLDIGMTAGLL